MKIGKFKKIAAIGLALTMAIGLLYTSGTVNAVDSNINVTRKDDPNIVTNKKVVWDENSNTAKITLEAYAKGSASSKSIPLDIVLVLDQSGSMGNRLSTLKTSVSRFVYKIQDDAKKNNVNHRVAMVGYASSPDVTSSDDWENTGLFVNGEFKKYKDEQYQEIYLSEMSEEKKYYISNDYGYTEISYNQRNEEWGYYGYRFNWNPVSLKNGPDEYWKMQAFELVDVNLTTDDYKNALVSANQNGVINSDLTSAINSLKANGSTSPYYGMIMANQIFANNPINSTEKRKRIVVVFTDGMPGFNNYQFSESEADNAIKESYKSKNTYNADVYSIGFNISSFSNAIRFMQLISSNYPDVESWNTNKYPYGYSSQKFYYSSSNSTGLDSVFDNIYNEISGTDLTENAVISDVISDVFELPSDDNINTYDSDIKVYTSQYLGENSRDKWSQRNIYNDAKVTIDDRAVNVSGFDFKDNYVLEKNPETNKPSGKKIIIEITVRPIDGFIGGNNILTNGIESGVYSDKEQINEETLVENFEQPNINVQLRYNPIGNDRTIYETTEWNEIIQFFSEDNKIVYLNNRNQKQVDTKYPIDGKVNAYVDIKYTVYSADKQTVYGTYTIDHGKSSGKWENNTNINSADIHECKEFIIDCEIVSINNETNYIDKSLQQTLHILKPTINVKNETIDYGSKIDVLDKCVFDNSIVWNDKNHQSITEGNSVTSKPILNIELINDNHVESFKDNVFIPQQVQDGQFSLLVTNKNNDKNVHANVYNKSDNKFENKVMCYVIGGSLVINKDLPDEFNKSDSDGSPIFTYKITVKNELLFGDSEKVYYRYTKNPIKSSSEVLSDLPIGEWKIEELDTLRYSFLDVNLDNYIPSDNYSYEKQMDSQSMNIYVKSFCGKKDFKVTFSNTKKTSDKDSDNDIVVNTFKYVNGEIQIGQELKD